MVYQRIRHPKLADAIVSELENLILEGSLTPGQKLPPERELAKQFDVSRPSLREAIQKLEAKGLLTRRQGGGTFVTESLLQSFEDPLQQLLSSHDEAQFDLLEFRHALEGISAYYAALRGTEADFQRLRECDRQIVQAHAQGDSRLEARAVMQLNILISEASHNVVLLHLVRGLSRLLEDNVLHNFELLYRHEEVGAQITRHRQQMINAILAGKPEQARDASYTHLAFIEETLLQSRQEDDRAQRAKRRMQQRSKE